MGEPPLRRGDVAPYVEDERPATVADIRGLRRWLVVTAVWAAAATALGVIALIQANKDDTSGRTQSAADLARVQRDLAGRIDDLKSQVDALPTSDDVSKLDNRIKELETKADKSASASDTDKLNSRVDDLEKRVDDVEQTQQTQTNTTTTPERRGAPLAGRPSVSAGLDRFLYCDRRDQPRSELPAVPRLDSTR
jgi:polyhydroxyalkanoate synthesis regulator phasin